MTRWKITLEYDGTGFSGWQKQSRVLSVQETIEAAVTKFTGETPVVHVAGRTDAGVHALAQVAHFDLEKDVTTIEVLGAMNFYMRPHPVSIIKAEIVPDDFHARFSALARSYRYVIINRRAPLTLMKGKASHFLRPLDIAPMQEAASLILGKHDFSTFRAQGCQAKSPIRTLDQLTIRREGETIIFETKARSFLYHQVRNMVGTLALVGSGHWSLDDFNQAFQAADRTKGGPTAPPDGLYFMGVDYPA